MKKFLADNTIKRPGLALAIAAAVTYLVTLSIHAARAEVAAYYPRVVIYVDHMLVDGGLYKSGGAFASKDECEAFRASDEGYKAANERLIALVKEKTGDGVVVFDCGTADDPVPAETE